MPTSLRASDLRARHCAACTKETPALADPAVRQALADLPGWELLPGERPEIAKTYKFANYYETIAFVNAIAWVSHREDHHPDLAVGYNRCRVAYSTHAIGGISENDLICAAKVEGLVGGAA